MKRSILSALLTAILLLGLTACGGKAEPAAEPAGDAPLTGGWYAPDETTALPLPEDAQAAFDKAISDFDGSTVEPMALLGTQVVAGTNYAVLCRVTPDAPDAVPSTQVATVYADLQGGASFTGFRPIDPAGFNQ